MQKLMQLSNVWTFPKVAGVDSMASHPSHVYRDKRSYSKISINGELLGNEHSDTEVSGNIYIHWPYCAKRCTYCSFNKYIIKEVSTFGNNFLLRLTRIMFLINDFVLMGIIIAARQR